MDRSDHETRAFRDGFHASRQELSWLYDPITEEFRQAPGAPVGQYGRIRIRHPTAFRRRPPRDHWARLVYELFALGWIAPIMIFGTMALALIGWGSGF